MISSNHSNTKSPCTRVILLGIWSHLVPRRRLQLGLLLALVLLSGVAELASLGAVLPFLTVLSDPDLLWQRPFAQVLATRLGLTEASQLLMPASVVFAFAAVLSALIRIVNLQQNVRLAAAIGSDISCEVYRRTLYQPYWVHLKRNSAAVITSTTSQVNITVAALNALLQLITSVVVAASLLTGLLLIDAPVALATSSLFGSAYGLLAVISSRELRSNGKKIVEASNLQLKALQEGLGAIREVLLDGSQPTYLQIYRKADRPQRQLQAKNVFLGMFPRYALEALGMVAIALLGGLLVLQRGSSASVIPLLGALALGAQRLLPALQQIYRGWASLKSSNAAMQDVLLMLNQPLSLEVYVDKPLALREGIRLGGVHFRYGPDQPEVLRGLDLEIRRGERIGLIGTGSGKSTTVDLLMGLLAPSAGVCLSMGWTCTIQPILSGSLLGVLRIAHVPQSIYLADSSIAENIAFGVPRHEIDGWVKQAASKAHIAGFIESSPEGYDSFVGERGIRLSGGQRQRIGIARALYKHSKVLVFDEATSALDNDTEAEVIESIEALNKDLTVVMIAHRLSTIARCDRVVDLSHGSVKRIFRPSSS